MKYSLTSLALVASAQIVAAQTTYIADYTVNPFLDGSATDTDDSSWVSSAYGRTGAVVSNPDPVATDEESFYQINSSFFSSTVNTAGDSYSLKTSFYSDSTTGSGVKESTVYISLAPGVSALLGDIGDGSGNEQISLGIGGGLAVVSSPGFTLSTDVWVDVDFEATYMGDDGGGNALFDYRLKLSGGMTGDYTATGIAQPANAVYDVVGSAQSPQFGQEGDFDAQTIFWAAPVPEPSSTMLVGLGMMSFILRRKRS